MSHKGMVLDGIPARVVEYFRDLTRPEIHLNEAGKVAIPDKFYVKVGYSHVAAGLCCDM
jgi:hypothetical protein